MGPENSSAPTQSIPKRKPVPIRTNPTAHYEYKEVPKSDNQAGKIFRKSVSAWDLSLDLLLCLAPLSFFALAGLAMTLNGKPLSTFGHNIQAWSLLAPTLFPLVFAAVVGRALESLARYKLERGTSLGVLEQLVGSQTVFAAIWIQLVLRTFNLLGVLLILLWLISPLGGQAGLRLLSEVKKVNVQDKTFAIVNGTSQISGFSAGFAQTLSGVSINALYSGCLVAPLAIKNGAQDTWGNIKIPRFETYNQTLDDEGFATIPEEDVDWVSLLGQPVAGLEKGFDSNFTMRTSYHDLQCSNLRKMPANSDWVGQTLGDSAHGENAITIWGLSGQYSSWLLWLVEPDIADGSLGGIDDPNRNKFIWMSKSGLLSNVQEDTTVLNYHEACLADCSMTGSFFDAYVACHGLSCRVTKMKKAPPPPEPWGDDLLMTSHGFLFTYFWENLVGTDTRAQVRTSSVTEHYVYGHVESPYQYGVSNNGDNLVYLDMTEVPLSDFTRRLRQVLNTYYIASLAPQASTGTLSSANVSKLLKSGDQASGTFYPLSYMPTVATLSSSTDIYHCNRVFFALSIASSAILFITGLAGAVAKYCCRGPDVLGYVTSIVRHNPHTPLQTQTEAVDTSKLARQSKKMFLRLEDVNDGSSHVGHIAISSKRRTSLGQARTQDPRRLYR